MKKGVSKNTRWRPEEGKLLHKGVILSVYNHATSNQKARCLKVTESESFRAERKKERKFFLSFFLSVEKDFHVSEIVSVERKKENLLLLFFFLSFCPKI